MKIISLLNGSRKLLVSEVLELVELILLVPTTNAISERSRSTLCRVKTYLRSSLTQEPVTSCVIVTAYKKQVDERKQLKQQASFASKRNIGFQLKNRFFPRQFTESTAKGTQTTNQRCSSVETPHFMVYVYIYIYIYIYIHIYVIYIYNMYI